MNVNNIAEQVRGLMLQSPKSLTDGQVEEIIESVVWDDPGVSSFPVSTIKNISHMVFCRLRRDADILESYLEDDQVTEIMVNGVRDVFVERSGQIERVSLDFEKADVLEEVIRRLSARVYREINEQSPIVDARLSDGSRMNAVYKNVALNGPILTIRKFSRELITMERLIDEGGITETAAMFLQDMVSSGYNIFISGGTSSGKTTFLNILARYIPSRERVIVIEDSAELQIHHLPNLVRMECKSPNAQGKGQVTMEQLIRTSLRMRPDRIIVGEVRGAEVMDMIQAMNTGHNGSLSTGHGNSAAGMLRRLESMYLLAAKFPLEAIRGQIGEGIDIMVHLGKTRDGKRRVLEISELSGLNEGGFQLNRLFLYAPRTGLVPTGQRIVKVDKFNLSIERMHE